MAAAHLAARGLADLAVTGIADWSAVHLVRGSRVEKVAVAHLDPEKIEFVAGYNRTTLANRSHDILTAVAAARAGSARSTGSAAQRDRRHLRQLSAGRR